MSGASATVYTVNGYEFGEAASCMQKCVRAGLEYEALYFALELAEAGYDLYVWKRLSIMAVEDVGMGDKSVIAVVNACRETWVAYRRVEKGKSILPESNIMAMAIVAMCRAPKNREADDLSYLMQQDRLKGLKLDLPTWAIDGHTAKGKSALRELAKKNGTTFHFEWCKEFYEDVGRSHNPTDWDKDGDCHGRNWSKIVAETYGSDWETYKTPVKRTVFPKQQYAKVWQYQFSSVEFEIEMIDEPGLKYFVDFDANNQLGACSCDQYLAGVGRWCRHMHEAKRWATAFKPGTAVTKREKPTTPQLESERNLKKEGLPLPKEANPPGPHPEEGHIDQPSLFGQ